MQAGKIGDFHVQAHICDIISYILPQDFHGSIDHPRARRSAERTISDVAGAT